MKLQHGPSFFYSSMSYSVAASFMNTEVGILNGKNGQDWIGVSKFLFLWVI